MVTLRKCIQKLIGWMFRVFKKWGLALFVGFGIAILSFVGINMAMVPVSTSEYCGTNCHEMHTALHTWKGSSHGGNEKGLQAECIDCHLPHKEEGFFAHLIAKAYDGGRDVYKHYFGGPYESEKIRVEVLDRMKNDRCTRCHVSLLGEPSSEMVREVHMEALSTTDDLENRCVDCHEDVGHQR